MMTLDATGLILAGGRGSRMGGAKASALLRGRPLIQWSIDLLADLCREVLICGSRPELAQYGLPVIPDRNSGCGPLEGLARGLHAAGYPWCLVAPCDAPFLVPELYQMLWELRSDAGAVVPLGADGRMQPLCALYPKAWGRRLDQALERGKRRISEIVVDLGFVALPGAGRLAVEMFRNINTPAQLRAAELTLVTPEARRGHGGSRACPQPHRS